MYQDTIETLALSASEQQDGIDDSLHSSTGGGYHKKKISCEGTSASSPPVTWRHRHRKPKKDRSPLTKREVLEKARKLAGKYHGILAAKRDKMTAPTPEHVSDWEGDHFVEETTMYRLLGDAIQQMADLVERIKT